MSEQDVLYATAERVATITLNRPQAFNAFSGTMREDVFARLRDAEQDRAVGAVVITGAGQAFCAGGDIVNMIELQARNDATPITARTGVAAYNTS